MLQGDGLSETSEKPAPEKGPGVEKYTSIRLRKETVEQLKDRGRKGESYDDVIKRLLEKRKR